MRTSLLVLAASLCLTCAHAQAPFCPDDAFGAMPFVASSGSDLVSVQGIVYGCYSWDTPILTKYDPSNGTAEVISTPPFLLFENSLAAHGDKLYLFGGYTGSSSSNQAWAYDLVTNSWQSLPNMPVSMHGTSAVTVEGDIYITGGTFGVTQQYFLRFDVEANSYTMLSPPAAYGASKLVMYNGQVYCLGGLRFNGNVMETSNLFKVYDASLNTWQDLPAMPFARGKVGATIWGDFLYVFGGCTVTGGVFVDSYTWENEYFASLLSGQLNVEHRQNIAWTGISKGKCAGRI